MHLYPVQNIHLPEYCLDHTVYACTDPRDD